MSRLPSAENFEDNSNPVSVRKRGIKIYRYTGLERPSLLKFPDKTRDNIVTVSAAFFLIIVIFDYRP